MNLDFSDPVVINVMTVIALVIMLSVVWVVIRQRNRARTAELRARFGAEYDLALREHGSRNKTEAALLGRIARVNRMAIHPLSDAERERYLAEWDDVQARFIDHPRSAVTEADELINSLLHARGYAGGPFDQRAADLSVHHSNLVEPYRRATAAVRRAGKNEATTEELRAAMLLYRTIIEELIQVMAPIARSEAA